MQLQRQLQLVEAVNAAMKFEYVSSGNRERFGPGLTQARGSLAVLISLRIHPRSSALQAAN